MLSTSKGLATHECTQQERRTGRFRRLLSVDQCPPVTDLYPRSLRSTDRIRGHPCGIFPVKPLLALTLLGGLLATQALLVILLSHLAPFLWQRRLRHWTNFVIMPSVLSLSAFIPLLDGGAKGGEWVQVWWAYPVAGLYAFSNESPDQISIAALCVVVGHQVLAIVVGLFPGLLILRRRNHT
jgi:hypothetical protein